MSKLSPKHQAVHDLVVADPKRNVARAYKTVYQCSDKTAADKGSKLSKKVEFAQFLQESLDKLSEKAMMTAEELIEINANIARAVPSDFFDSGPDGTWIPKNLEDIPRDKQMALESVSCVTIEAPNGNILTKQKLKLVDKHKSMDFLGKALGMFQKDADPHGDRPVFVGINLTLHQDTTPEIQSPDHKQIGNGSKRISVPKEIKITTSGKSKEGNNRKNGNGSNGFQGIDLKL